MESDEDVSDDAEFGDTDEHLIRAANKSEATGGY